MAMTERMEATASPGLILGQQLQTSIEDYRITRRQKDVVKGLILGCTNKEIAVALGTAEQTIKEHIKHLMKKTGTTTRTGILSKLFRLERAIEADPMVTHRWVGQLSMTKEPT